MPAALSRPGHRILGPRLTLAQLKTPAGRGGPLKVF